MPRVAAALLVAPLLVCVLLQVAHADAYAISRGDVATLELRILHALRLQQWLGPYSRFDVSHPGPVYFYLLAPAYVLSGRAAGSMYVMAAAINLAACVGILRVAWPRVTAPLPRAAVLLGTTTLLGVLVDAHAPLALATPWNPYVTILPFALLLMLCTAADSAWRGWIAAVVGLHAFVAQTHAAYLLPATAALGLGLLWRWRTVSTRRAKEALAGALLVAALWLPTALDEIAGTHNLRRMLSVATEHAKLGLTAAEVLATLSDRVAFGSPVVLVLLVLALGWSRARVGHEPATFRARLTTLALVQLGAATLVLARLDAPRNYLTAWVWVVAFVAWLAVALAWLPSALPDRWRRVPLAVATVGVCVSGFHQLRVTTQRMRKVEAAASRRGADVLRLADAFDRLHGDDTRPLLVSRSPEHWHVFAGLVLQLLRRGEPLVVEPKWRHMLGQGVPIAEGTEPRIELVVRDGTLSLLAEPTLRVPATIVESVGVAGDLAVLLDGDAPPDGTRPSTGNAVELQPDGWITLQLDAGADRLQLTAIGDDWFRIEGSWDGVRFEPIALTPRAGGGLRTRAIDLWTAEIRPWAFVRISPHDGPWPFWVSELTPLRRPS